MEQLKACGLKTVSEQLKLRKLITLKLEQPTKQPVIILLHLKALAVPGKKFPLLS